MSQMADQVRRPVGWVCFHCGEHFLSAGDAVAHFGHHPTATPACALPPEHIRTELRRFRLVEEKLRLARIQIEAVRIGSKLVDIEKLRLVCGAATAAIDEVGDAISD